VEIGKKLMDIKEKNKEQLDQFYDIHGYDMFIKGILSFVDEWSSQGRQNNKYVFRNNDEILKENYPLTIVCNISEFWKRCGADICKKRFLLQHIMENDMPIKHVEVLRENEKGEIIGNMQLLAVAMRDTWKNFSEIKIMISPMLCE
jgi:hypothetical protein